MRHQKRGNKLGRTASHRKAMLSNMVSSLFLHKQIKTTEAKAKEARRLAERLITHAKKESTHARRLVFAVLRDKKATTILFEEIAPVYANRQGGYTRLIKLGYRPNDSAPMVLLQLVDFFSEESAKDKKVAAKKAAARTAAKTAAKKEIKTEKAAGKAEKKEEKAEEQAETVAESKTPKKETAVSSEEAEESAVETASKEKSEEK